MITDQSVIRDMPGAYEVAVCDRHGRPLTEWVSLAPRTLFDEAIRAELSVTIEGDATGIVDRNGRYKRMFVHPRRVMPDFTVRLIAGADEAESV